MKKYCLMILGIAVFSGCGLRSEKHISKAIYRSYLADAFNKGDTAFVLSVLENLADSSISDIEFYDILVRLSQVSGFYYGNIDARDTNYQKISRNQRQTYRKNTVSVYMQYKQSCLFMKKADVDVTASIAQDFWLDDRLLNATELLQVKRRFNEICRKGKANER